MYMNLQVPLLVCKSIFFAIKPDLWYEGAT